MLEIETDGKLVEVADGSTVMEAAASAGTYIPHFCYHKKLSIAANCRMCLVQVEKAPKPLPACATPVTNGMKVWTHSEQAVKAQKGVMEFLLINHPLDCPICDQGGECQLQDLAVGYGAAGSRYEEEKRVVSNKNLGSLVATDMTRCIHCTRCVRFTTEIAGETELGQAFRGEHAEIMPFIEKTVDSELSGNIIDLCPVGALTSKPFRFAARTWELSRRRSVSPHDALGANLIVQTKHDVVKRVLPFENDEINECWLSDKDRFAYEGLNSEERLTAPMIRQGGEWKQVDWQTALEFVANGLRGVIAEHGAHSLGALASPHATLEELYLLQKLVRGLGSENIDFRLRELDFRADGKRRGAPWLGMPIAAVKDLNRLLVIGSFLRKDAPLLAQRVRQAAKKGLKINAIGPNAEDWLLPVHNRALVSPANMVATLAQLVELVATAKGEAIAPELQLKTGGEPTEALQAMADSLLSGQKVAIWLGSLAVQHERASELQALAQELTRLCGDKACFGFIGEAANSVGGYLAGAIPAGEGLSAAQMIRQPRKAYIVLGAEAEYDFNDAPAATAAFEQAQLLIALSSFDSPSLRKQADVLLPLAPFSETSGSYVNCEGRLQSFNAVARPLAEVRPGWKILRVLGNLLQLAGFEQASSEAVRKEAVPTDFDAALDNAIEGIIVNAAPHAAGKVLERVSDVPIYFADPIVRRAPALQKTRDAAAPSAALAPATLAALGINAGDKLIVRQGEGRAELLAVSDEGLAPACVRIAAAHVATAGLGSMSGEISVERA